MKVKLESFLQEVSEKTTENNQYQVLTSSKVGLYLQSDYFNKQVASKDNKGYKIIKKGQFTYRAMSDTGEFFPNMLECTDIGIVSPAYPVFEIVKPVIIPEYLKYYFKSNGFQQSISSFAQGSTRTSIKYGKLKTVSMDLPNLEEQKRVIAILDTIHNIIDSSKQELKMFDDLIKARFVEMFGDSASNEKGWKMNTFGDICTVRQGLQIPISKRLTEYEEDSYEYITVQYLHGGKEKEYIKSPKESVKCTKDDILMTRTGNTGMVVTNVEGVFHNNFFLIDFDRERFEKDFLVEYLNLDLIQADITRRAGTSTIPDLNHGEFYKIKVFEPPIDLQKEFDEFKMQVDKSKVAVQKALDETQTLLDSLMQEYFG